MTEADRLQALIRYQVLDSPAELTFDRVTALAARLFAAPIALVSLVDADRQWFKSCLGLPVRETPRDIAFCSHAIEHDEPLVVTDATQDPRFCDNPLVTGDPNIRFYAGAPLLTPDGQRIGTLCVIDTVPRSPLSIEELATLTDLAAIVVDELELRRAGEEVRQANEDLRAARDEAERTSRAKSDFLSGVSHELRTPLASISGYAELLAYEELGPPAAEYVEHLTLGCRTLNQLIDDLLDLAAAESGLGSLTVEDVALDEVLAEVLSLVEPLAAEAAVHVWPVRSEGSYVVQADRRGVFQILLNLVSNAVKYNRTHGDLVIAVDPTGGGQVRVAVTDRGDGIRHEDLDAVFEPFVRLQPAAAPGTGLGLPLARALAESMGGSLGAVSVVGAGSTFWVDLPTA